MCFLGEEKPLAKPAGEIGFKLSDTFRVQRPVSLRAAGKSRKIGRIAQGCEHQAAALDGAGEDARPEGKRLLAEPDHQRLRALGLAPRRQHAARIAGAGEGAQAFAALQHPNRGTGLGQRPGGGQPRNTGPDDCNLQSRAPHPIEPGGG